MVSVESRKEKKTVESNQIGHFEWRMRAFSGDEFISELDRAWHKIELNDSSNPNFVNFLWFSFVFRIKMVPFTAGCNLVITTLSNNLIKHWFEFDGDC